MIRLSVLAILLVPVAGCSQNAGSDAKNRDERQVGPNTPKSDIEPIVRRVVGERLKVKPESLDMRKPIADELDVVQIVMTLEDRLMFEIPDRVITGPQKGHAPV